MCIDYKRKLAKGNVQNSSVTCYFVFSSSPRCRVRDSVYNSHREKNVCLNTSQRNERCNYNQGRQVSAKPYTYIYIHIYIAICPGSLQRCFSILRHSISSRFVQKSSSSFKELPQLPRNRWQDQKNAPDAAAAIKTMTHSNMSCRQNCFTLKKLALSLVWKPLLCTLAPACSETYPEKMVFL